MGIVRFEDVSKTYHMGEVDVTALDQPEHSPGGVSTVVSLQALSFKMQPGMTWSPVTNLEINFRVGIPIGPANTDFGEKPDAFRPELWARYYY